MERLRILGGTEIFGLFLPRYDVFHLSRVAGLRLSGGRPVFPQVSQFSVEAVLASSKLSPTAQLPLDEARGVTLSLGFERFAAVKSSRVRVMPASF
jgi:dihydrofolate reductase